MQFPFIIAFLLCIHQVWIVPGSVSQASACTKVAGTLRSIEGDEMIIETKDHKRVTYNGRTLPAAERSHLARQVGQWIEICLPVPHEQ